MGLFKSDSVQISHDISVVYSPAAGSQVIELVCNNPNHIRNKFGLGNVPGVANGLLDELRCYAAITSLPSPELPNISGEDTESEKLTKAQSYEWGTARFELVVYKRAKNSADWAEFGTQALKNAGGFRWRLHRILDLTTDNIGARVGEWARIGVAIRSVGYGMPASFDRITFTGHWVQEFTWVQEHPTYVQINQYGSSPSPTPTPAPTPTPTPTPPTPPTVTLALASGTTTANANNDDKINLTITNIASGTQLSAKWYKEGVDTGLTESITTTGAPIQLSTLKLRDKLSGNYRLDVFYNSVAYPSNAVSVSVTPEITLSLPSGATTANTGDQTLITVSGKYFSQTGSQAIIYQLLKASDNSVAYTSSGGVNSPQTLVDGAFTFTINSSVLASATTGEYKLKFHFNDLTTTAYLSKNNVSVTVTAAPPTVVLSPTAVNTTSQGTAVSISRTFTGFPNGFHAWTWQKDGVDMNNGGSQYIASANALTVSQQVSAFSTGNGTYRIKITANSVIYYSNNLVITS